MKTNTDASAANGEVAKAEGPEDGPLLENARHALPELLSEQQAIEVMLDNVMDLLPCEVAAVAHLDEEKAAGYYTCTFTIPDVGLEDLRNRLQADLAGYAQKPVTLEEISATEEPRESSSVSEFQPWASSLSMPVFTAGEVVGLLLIASRKEAVFGFGEERILSTLATNLSLAFQQIYYQHSMQIVIEELDGLNRTLARLHGAVEKFNSIHEEAELYELVLGISMHEMSAEAGSILIVNEETGELEVAASRGLDARQVNSGSQNRVRGIARWVIENGKYLALGPSLVQTDIESVADGRRIAHSLVAPLRGRHQVIGTLNLNRIKNPEPYTPVQTEAMLLIVDAASAAIDNLRMHEKQLQQEKISTIGMTVMGIGHYIKNLNTVLQVGRKLVDQAIEARNWDSLEAAWGAIRRGTDRLTNLSMDMLDFSRPKVPRTEETDLHDLLRQTISEVEIPAAHNGVEVSFESRLDSALVEVDSQQIHRCIMNLVTNAIDAMPDGGRLTIRTKRVKTNKQSPGSWTVCSFEDTGTGINEEDMEKIFQPLFSTKGSRGTGIGLAVTRKIIEEHGGRIEVTSRAHEGTTFKIFFPTKEG